MEQKVIGQIIGNDFGKIIEAMEANKEVYMMHQVSEFTSIGSIMKCGYIIVIDSKGEEQDESPEEPGGGDSIEETDPVEEQRSEEEKTDEDIRAFVAANFGYKREEQEENAAGRVKARRGRPKKETDSN